jgi:hypothetical protein
VRGGDLLYKEPRKIEVKLTLTTGDVKQQEVLEFRTMDKVQKPSINECYTPSSEPYRVYKKLYLHPQRTKININMMTL